MLLRFLLANFASLRDEQELSLVATSLKDEEEGLIEPTSIKEKLLPSAVLYGANASGKSNVLAGLRLLQAVALQSHLKDENLALPVKPFALNETGSTQPCRFEIDFLANGTRYHFGFELTARAVESEWLYSFPSGRRQLLYERKSGNPIQFGRAFRGRNKIIADLTRRNSLFFSAALQNNHEEITQISSFFKSIRFHGEIGVPASQINLQFGRSGIDPRAIEFLKLIRTGVIGARPTEREITPLEATLQQEMRGLLKRILKQPPSEEDLARTFGPKELEVELAHQGANGKQVFFTPADESSGTRRLLVLVTQLYEVIDNGGLLVVDELDASLHTQACEAFVSLLSRRDSNPKAAQLIATTHDTNLMCSPILRRDQIWFTEKDDTGATHLFPLSDIQTRRTDNIEKGYLQGRFGAIPFAGSTAALFGN